MKRRRVVGNRLFGMLVLAFEVGEELDGLNVGVAVDDTAGHCRPHMREIFGSTPDLGHEICQR